MNDYTLYTPTTNTVRRAASDFQPPITPEEFDRWLAAHDAEVRAEAWEVGAKNMMQAIGDTYGTLTFIAPHNPFRGDPEGRAGVVAEEPAPRSLTPDEINALPIGSVVMTETIIESFGAYEQRVWQKFGGQPDWQFGVPRHEWQSTDGGFERVGNADRHRGQFGFNRRVTLLWVPVKQEGAGHEGDS